MTLQSFDNSGGIAVVDLCDVDAVWELSGTIVAGDGCDGVLAGFQKLFSHEAAAMAASLRTLARDKWRR